MLDRVDVMLSVDLELVMTEKDRDSGVKTSRIAYYAILRDTNGKVIDEIYRIKEVLRGDASKTHFVQRISFAQPDGEYQAEVSVADLIGNGFTSAVAMMAPTHPLAAK